MNPVITFPLQFVRLWFVCSLIISIALVATVRAEPAMWVIRDKDSTIYLIGTVHALRPEMEWSNAKVKKTVAESTELWLEVADFDDEGGIMPLVAQYGVDLEHTLSSKLSNAQKEKLTQVAATYGVPAESLDPVKPWMAAMMFTVLPMQKAGYDQNGGVDRFLKAQAQQEGHKVLGFETAEEQVRFFADLPEPEQIAFLDQTLRDAEKGVELLERLAKAWADGDTDTIANMLVNELKKESPALYQKLVVQRNIAWSERIVQILKGSGVQQIAVGAAHLAGPDSVQAQLTKRGIRVDRY